MALTTNLIWAWHFDESSGNASDSSGNWNTLVNNGTIGFSSGKFSNCADLWTTNTTKYFSLASAILDTSTTGNSSVGGWVNISTAPASGVDYELYGAIKNGWRSFEYKYSNISWTLCLNLTVYDGSTSWVYQQNVTLTVGTWYHVIWTVSWNSISTYLNWVQLWSAQTITNTSNSTTVNNFTVWRHPNASYWYACSNFDETWAWTRAITATEVAQLYNSWNWLIYPFTSIFSNFLMYF